MLSMYILIESLSKGESAPTGASIGISGYMIDENTSKIYEEEEEYIENENQNKR